MEDKYDHILFRATASKTDRSRQESRMNIVAHAIVTAAAAGAVLTAAGAQTTPRKTPAPTRSASATPKPAVSHPPATGLSIDAQNQLVRQYCLGCHNDKTKAGELSLSSFDGATAVQHADVAEKMIRKLRAGMMPPPGVRRPDGAAIGGMIDALESTIDAAAAASPNPGWRPFQRLNRAEYARTVHDLLGLDVDVNAYLPPDTISGGFDNVADVQSFSPTLMEGYLRAASQISRLAVGDRNASPTAATHKIGRTAAQMRHVESATTRTRRGMPPDDVVHAH